MPAFTLQQLQRRKRQLDTLRRMLSDVEELLAMVQHVRDERELTGAEEAEAALLIVRHERLSNSIAEAEAASGDTGRSTRG